MAITDKYKKWVIIRIETKSREFLSKMLITRKLVEEGYGVIITNKAGIDTKMFPKGVYIINSIFKNGLKNILKLKKDGQIIVLIDEEGLVHLSREKYVSRLHRESLMLLDYIYCWGEDQAGIVLEQYPQLSSKVKITGNPRMNLLNEKLRPLIISDDKRSIKNYGDYILVVSNFTYVNFNCPESTREGKKNVLKKRLAFMGVENDTKFEEHYDHILKIYLAMQRLIEKIHAAYPKYNIIVRPHPSEDSKDWEFFAEKLKRVYVVREGDMNSWLIHAKMVIQNSCTSAIESLYLGIPCISYRPFVNEQHDQPLPNLLSKNVFTEEEALLQVNKVLIEGGKYNYSKYLDIASHYVSNQDDSKSVDAIVNNINQIDIKPVRYNLYVNILRRFHLSHIKYEMKEVIKTVIRNIPRRFLNNVGEKTKNRIMPVINDDSRLKYGNIDKEEIINTLNRISLLYGNETKFHVVKAGREFIITKV